VPALTPDTIPLDDPIVALAGTLLVQVPPPGVPVSVLVQTAHIKAVPVIDGAAVTVNTAVLTHDADSA
jgi:hypothetical protein